MAQPPAADCFEDSERTLAHVLARRLRDRPDQAWIRGDDAVFTYRDADRLAAELAGGLAALGVSRGDTVLLMLEDCIEFVALWCALGRLAAIEVPVNRHYRGSLLAHVVSDSAASVIVIDAEYLPRLAEVADACGGLATVVVRGEAETVVGGLRVVPFARLAAAPVAAAALQPWDLAAVMYTSGTTGASKGVAVTHGHAFEYARGVIDMLAMRASDVYYAPLPLFHIAGQWAVVYAAAIAGATAVLADSFSPRQFWERARRHGATCAFVLGAMANLLHRQPPLPEDADNPLERLLMVPLIDEVEEFKRRFRLLVSTTWGGTEMNCPTRSGFDLPDARTCGRLDERRYELRIVDANDCEVPDGTPGEAVVRPRKPWMVMDGYWRRPDVTVRAWRNLWLHTGDILSRDPHGNYYFVDRSKDAIRRRGENISSMEVEREINAHPDVLESAAFPVAAELGEQEVMAVVVPRPGCRVVPEALTRFLVARMAYFMVPRYLEFADTLPKTPTGKIQKFALRERGVTAVTWDRVQAGVTLKR